MINPKVAPQKNNGMIKPPRHPDVTVMAIAIILKNKMAISIFKEKSLIKSVLSS